MEGKHEMKRGAARMNLRMREGRAGSRDGSSGRVGMV